MSVNQFVRQSHRWFSVAFTLSVIATTIALSMENPVIWVSYIPLLPLFLLFISGAYLYVMPYLGRNRVRRSES